MTDQEADSGIASTPEPPPCTPWCTHNHEPDSWDIVNLRRGEAAGEYVKVCRRTVTFQSSAHDVDELQLMRWAEVDTEATGGLLELDEPKIAFEPHEFTVARAREFAAKLGALLNEAKR